MPLIKSRASLENLVLAPYAGNVRGAVCLTCGKLVDYEGVVEGYPTSPQQDGTTWCKYLVRHHGSEELRRFDMGSSNWDYQDAAQLAQRTNWFDPTAHEGLGLGVTVSDVGEHDDKEEFKVIVDVGAKK